MIILFSDLEVNLPCKFLSVKNMPGSPELDLRDGTFIFITLGANLIHYPFFSRFYFAHLLLL